MPAPTAPTTTPKPPKSEKKNKKPYHIKRADLDLPSYIAERDSKSPSLLLRRGLTHLRHSYQFRLYLGLQLIAAGVGYGQAMVIVGLLWAMVANTGRRREGEMSAYSLFNEGVQGIAGSTDMEALDRELRTRGV